MTSPSPNPAERETPAGEAMREAVAQWLRDRFPLNTWQSTAQAIALLKSGPIASELARLTARAEVAKTKAENADLIAKNEWLRSEALFARALAAEAALTTIQAEHASEMARLRANLTSKES